MRVHRNAKTTPHGRQLLLRRVDEGWTMAAATAAAGLSERSGFKWRRRQRSGDTLLVDASSRPRRQPRETPVRLQAQVLALRHQRWAGWQIAHVLRMPRSTVGRLLRRAGLNRLPAVTPPIPVVRYEWAAAGDLLHVDVKPLMRIAGVGHRIHGDRRQMRRGIGREYVHVAIDDHSRVAYAEVLEQQDGRTSAAFLERAVAWFRQHGVVIRRVMSDNGSGYVARVFRRAAEQLAVRHLRTRPYTPRTNGKAERLIQTLLREWAYATSYLDSPRRTAALRPWLRYYNRRRPHTALGYQPPWSRLPAEQRV
jgi:transposase InsO family protein